MVRWVGEWLNCQAQKVMTIGKNSSWRPVTSSVPQESSTGQHCFTSSLVTQVTRREHTSSTFADDTELAEVANTSNGFVAIQGTSAGQRKEPLEIQQREKMPCSWRLPVQPEPWLLNLVQWQMSCLTAATSFSKALENSFPRSNLPLKTWHPQGLITTWNRVSLQQNILKINFLYCEISDYLTSQSTCHRVT